MRSNIYFIKAIGSGALSAMAKPDVSAGIEQEIAAIAASGITKIVSLLTESEAEQAGLSEEASSAMRAGLEFEQFAIGDFGVPSSLSDYCKFVRQQYEVIEAGGHTVVHCHAGIGRTGMFTASILLRSGYEPLDAFKLVSEQRGVSVPDTQIQIDWVCKNQQSIRNSN